ncbi:MAG: hypothetical protein KH006_09355, partial [Firmicutes bacterium]|nr:hypothetical protein [Bacillota bacterium]
VNPFCRKSFRCALRLGWPLASLRHSAPRKVFFATYTPPQKTDWKSFAPLRRELCETLFDKNGMPGGHPVFVKRV